MGSWLHVYMKNKNNNDGDDDKYNDDNGSASVLWQICVYIYISKNICN